MAVLGMRPLFFLLAGMVKLFRYLQYGLALILGFVGAKMIVEEAFHDFHVIGELGDIYLSLGIIIGILTGSVVLSMIMPHKNNQEQTHPAIKTNEPDA
jgi:tellurite resistance protein TerC